MTTKVFSSQTGDGQSSEINWAGGPGVFCAEGTWNSVTVTLQFSPDGGTTWFAVGSATTLTDNGVGSFNLPVCVIRADLGSTTSPGPSIDAWVL